MSDTIRPALSLHLLHFCRGGPEELDVAGADDVFVFGQGLLPLRLLGEQDEGIPGRPAVGLLHEENPVFLVQNIAGLLAASEELDLIKIESLSQISVRSHSQH